MPNLVNNKIVFGDTPVIDLTSDNVTTSDIADGVSFHLADGTVGIGTAHFGTGATVSGNNISMDGSVTDYVVPDWATCTDEELEEAIALSEAKGVNLKGIFDKQTGVTWAGGTDAQIARSLDLYYRGYLSLTQKWHVGDERTVSLSAMSATEVNESHAAQSVVYVLSNIGGKTLATPINGITECAFQVDQKAPFKNSTGNRERGYMNSVNTNSGSWKSCNRRTWCNSTYKNAIPFTLRGIFKEFINQTYSRTLGGIESVTDTFALRAEIEVLGATTYSVAGEGTYISWYYTKTDSFKTEERWLRSPKSNSDYSYCNIRYGGTIDHTSATSNLSIVPFGAI